MIFTIDIIKLVGIAINLLILLGIGIWYVYMKIQIYFESKKCEKYRKEK